MQAGGSDTELALLFELIWADIFVMFSEFFLEVIFQSRYVFGPH